MKTKLGVAIAMASLVPAISFAEPTVYGKLNVTFEPVTNIGDDSHTTLVDNSSRIGVKGSEELSEGISAIYVVEFSTSIDGDGSAAGRRNIYAGVKGDFGQVIAGKFDSPTKASQGKIDQFGDLRGDIAFMLTDSDQRVGNAVMYSTPGENINWNLMYSSSEVDGEDDGISTSLTFSYPAFYVGLAYDQDIVDQGVSNLRLSAQGFAGPVEIGGMIEQQDVDGADETFDAVMFSLGWNVTNATKLKLQLGQSDEKAEGGESASIGIDHKYSKNFTSYAYYTTESADNDVVDNDYLGLGVILKF